MRDTMTPAPLGTVSLGGRVGDELDKVVDARVLSAHGADEILPEAVEAFRKQEDDRLFPGRGLWQGEFWGKWMLSAVAAQRYTDDAELESVIQKSVDDLLATQRADGYIGTYHDSSFVEGNCWNVWCRKYTLWGLVDAYEMLADPKILSAACRFVDHLITEVGPGAVDMVKTGNFVGLPSSSILTPLIKLYRLSGEWRYMEYARYIVEQWSKFPGDPPDIVNQGLTGKPVHEWFLNAGRWTKAYEFISCVEGLLDVYRVEGNGTYLRAARNVYEAIRQHERVITGGIGYHDKLERAAFRDDGLNEPCDVVYWQRLSAQLLRLTGEPVYADEIERLTYNVLMASVNHDGSWALRRLGLSEPHLIAPLHCLLYHHQCCVANVPRGLVQLAEVAVMTGEEDGSVTVNLYIPSTTSVTLPSRQEVAIETITDYPESGDVQLNLTAKEPSAFPVKLRIPQWSAETTLEVNGEAVENVAPGTYAIVNRTWGTDDRVGLHLDMRARAVPFPGDSRHVAIERGPVVLARSALLEDGDIHEPLGLEIPEDGVLELEPVAAPEGIWMAFEIPMADGRTIRVCDYASTGKDYDKPTDPHATKQMLDNRTAPDLRVWLALLPTP